MYKIAVVGDYDSIFGFAALGLDTFAVQTREEAAEKLHQLAQGGYGIIYITEKLAAELTHEIEKYQEQVTPAIIQIPGIAGNTGAGVTGVKKSVEQAVGSATNRRFPVLARLPSSSSRHGRSPHHPYRL